MSGRTDMRSELLARALEDGAMAPQPDEHLRRELAVVDLLVRAGEQVRLDDAVRDRMRRRILAGLDELNEQDAVTPVGLAARRRSAVAGVQGRLLVAAAAALCLFVALSGMSLVLARDALPGDALYGVKRSAESAELGLTFGDEPRGYKHLQFASARIDEIEAIAARAYGAGVESGSVGEANRYLMALREFDTDAVAGSRLLIETATNGRGDELTALRAWAQQQRQRLDSAGAAMPVRAASRADGSIALLDRMIERVLRLRARLACLTVTSGGRDDVGLLPADGACVPVGNTPASAGGAHDSTGVSRTQPVPPPSLVNGSPSGGDPPLGPLDPGGGPGMTPPSSGSMPDTWLPGISPRPPTSTITVPLPLPLPEVQVPPPVPGLPGLEVG
jgi:Domain of unknown function (DUF5667)